MYLLQLPPTLGGEPTAIVGSSPEALVTVRDGHVTMHPIAGTRPRGVTEEDDILLAKDLLADEKERSEHVMLVDLGRNDLGRVCRPGTVKVVDFFTVERYSHVMHIVSTVTGELDDERTAFDALTACFPAGTLSGAPKPMAMRIIDELEPARRGLYGGIVGYLDFHGDADTAITIRTALVRGGTVHVQAGAGIVADSIPANEDAECRNKAAAVINAVAAANTLQAVPVVAAGARLGRQPITMKLQTAVLLTLAGSALTAGSTLLPWVHTTVQDDLKGTIVSTVTGAQAAPALLPLAAAAVAALGAVLAARGGLRRVIGAVMVLLGGGAAVLAIVGWARPGLSSTPAAGSVATEIAVQPIGPATGVAGGASAVSGRPRGARSTAPPTGR